MAKRPPELIQRNYTNDSRERKREICFHKMLMYDASGWIHVLTHFVCEKNLIWPRIFLMTSIWSTLPSIKFLYKIQWILITYWNIEEQRAHNQNMLIEYTQHVCNNGCCYKIGATWHWRHRNGIIASNFRIWIELNSNPNLNGAVNKAALVGDIEMIARGIWRQSVAPHHTTRLLILFVRQNCISIQMKSFIKANA